MECETSLFYSTLPKISRHIIRCKMEVVLQIRLQNLDAFAVLYEVTQFLDFCFPFVGRAVPACPVGGNLGADLFQKPIQHLQEMLLGQHGVE